MPPTRSQYVRRNRRELDLGAWGYKPFANDTALDWLHPINEHIAEHITTAFTNYLQTRVTKEGRTAGHGQYEMIAAGGLLLFLTTSPPIENPLKIHSALHSDTFRLAILCLEKLLDDPWIKQWGSSEPEKQYRDMLYVLKDRYVP